MVLPPALNQTRYRGGATALIASIQPSVVLLSWRYIYIVAITSLIMIGWALIINVSVNRPFLSAFLANGLSFLLLGLSCAERRPKKIPTLLDTRHEDLCPNARGEDQVRVGRPGGDGGRRGQKRIRLYVRAERPRGRSGCRGGGRG